jgi:hypothetical protein
MSLFFMFLDHTHTHTHGRTPLNEWSARRRGLYLHNTQQTQQTNTYWNPRSQQSSRHRTAWPPGLPISQNIPYITCRCTKLYRLPEEIISELFYEAVLSLPHFCTKITNKFVIALKIRRLYKFEATYFSCHRETNFKKVACLRSPIFRLQ